MVEFKIRLTRRAIVDELWRLQGVANSDLPEYGTVRPASQHILSAVECILTRRFGALVMLREVIDRPGTIEIIGSTYPVRTPAILRKILRKFAGVCGTPGDIAEEIELICL